MIWYGFQSAFILGILPHRAKKVKTLWKVGSTQISLQASTATLHGCNSTAISYPKISQTNVFFQQKSRRANTNVERDLEGMFIAPLPSHGEEATGVITETSPFKTFPWPWTCYWTNLHPGRISHSLEEQLWASHCLLLFQVSTANRNIVVCQERWAGSSFSYPQALLSLEFFPS